MRSENTARSAIARTLAAFAAAIALTLGTLIGAPSIAHAATQGAGFGTFGDASGPGWQGAFRIGNAYAYCFEPGRTDPTGSATSQGLVTSLTSRSPYGNATISKNRLAGINYVITTYGQTGNNVRAAAVNFAVKGLANWSSMMKSHGYTGASGVGKTNLRGYINWVLFRHASQSQIDSITDQAWQYYTEGRDIVAGSTATYGTVEFDVNPTSDYSGRVRVNVDGTTTGLTGSLTLENGLFIATGTDTMTGVQAGVWYDFIGNPPEGVTEYQVSASGTFDPGWPPRLRAWRHNSGNQQAVVATGGANDFTVFGTDPVFRGTQFGPVLSTSAVQFVQEGDYPTDTVTFTTQPDDNGVNNPWYQDEEGDYIQVVANGTLYGPFEDVPSESDEIPEDAPVAGTATVTTSPADGPTVSYTATSDTPVTESGYYTWVWEIAWEDQPPLTQLFIPGPSPANPDQEPYYFRDRFGLAAETSIVPSRIVVDTEVTTPSVAPGDFTMDQLTVRPANNWIRQDDGDYVPVVFRGTAYLHPGGVAPTQTSTIPAGATVLGEVTYTADGPGTDVAPGVLVPNDAAGFITWVWEVRHDDQPVTWRDYLQEWRSDYGIPSETHPIDPIFSPVVTTEAAQFVQPGEYPTDEITFSVVENSDGIEVPWRRNNDGSWVEVTATGILYGPFTAPPAQSSEVPEDAPIAGVATVTTSAEDGPTETYTATGSNPLVEAGYYTWVWTIDAANQPSGTEDWIPEDYLFDDDFGQVVETSIVPIGVVVDTAVTTEVAPIGGQSTDRITVRANADWLEGTDGPIEVVLRGTAYLIAGSTPPAQTDTIPAEAVALGSVTHSTTGPQTVLADSIDVPLDAEGYITWVWEVREEDQSEEVAGVVREWQSDFGIPSETQAVGRPSVVTNAVAGAGAGESISDTAAVTGHLPPDGALLGFELYQVPFTPDTDGSAVIDTTGGPADDLSWVCTPDNLVFSTTPFLITLTGNYASSVYTPAEHGIYLWVETLYSADGSQVIHRGDCGIPNETSYGIDVDTRARFAGENIAVSPGVGVWDTAYIEGVIPAGASIEFEAYVVLNSSSTPLADRCVADSLVWTSPRVELGNETRLYTEPREVTSAAHVFDPPFDSTLYWVAVTRDANDRVINRGECGDPNETVGLKGSLTIASGGDLAALIIGGVTLLGLLGAGLVVVARRRRA